MRSNPLARLTNRLNEELVRRRVNALGYPWKLKRPPLLAPYYELAAAQHPGSLDTEWLINYYDALGDAWSMLMYSSGVIA